MSELDDFKSAVGEALLTNLRPVLDGAEDDLRGYVANIADDMSRALATGDSAAKIELRAQLRALAGMNAIRARSAGWAALETVVGFAFDYALKTGVGALAQATGELTEAIEEVVEPDPEPEADDGVGEPVTPEEPEEPERL